VLKSRWPFSLADPRRTRNVDRRAHFISRPKREKKKKIGGLVGIRVRPAEQVTPREGGWAEPVL